MAAKTVTVGPGKTYASLQAAITGEATNLTTLGGILDIVCYSFNDTTAVNVTGYTGVDATHYVNIYTDATARHSGVWDGSKYNLIVGSKVTAITNTVAYTRITGLQVSVGATVDYGAWNAIITSAGNITANANIIRCTASAVYQSVVFAFYDNYSTGGNLIYNNLIYGFASARVDHFSGGMYLPENGDYVYSNTIVNCSIGIYLESYRTCVVINNLFSGCTKPIYGGGSNTWAGSGYNATDSANWGAGSSYTSLTGDRLSQTFTFVNAAASNYLLQTSDTGALGYGENLSADPNCPFFVDVTGTPRIPPWSIGADQPLIPSPAFLELLTAS